MPWRIAFNKKSFERWPKLKVQALPRKGHPEPGPFTVFETQPQPLRTQQSLYGQHTLLSSLISDAPTSLQHLVHGLDLTSNSTPPSQFKVIFTCSASSRSCLPSGQLVVDPLRRLLNQNLIMWVLLGFQ